MISKSPAQANKNQPRSHTQELLDNQTIDKTFPNQKKRRRSPIFRKCEDLMEQMWYDGYQLQITYKDLKYYLKLICGGFRTTITDYLGKRATYYVSPGRQGVLRNRARPGYLQEFGFISFKNPRIVFLHHERVDRPYHYSQTNMVSFSLSNNVETILSRKGVVDTTDGERRERDRQCEREIRESESNLTSREAAVLRSAKGEGG